MAARGSFVARGAFGFWPARTNGDDVDLIANRAIHSGQSAAYLEMRDQVLVQAQTQIDSITAGPDPILCTYYRPKSRKAEVFRGIDLRPEDL